MSNLPFEPLSLPELRPYQVDVRDRARAAAARCPRPVRVLLQASTGAGKSVIALDLVVRCWQLGRRALFIVSGRVLVNQFEKYLTRAGVPFGVIMAGRGRNDAPIQIASKETLTARSIRRQVQALPAADLVIIDEAHESTAPEWVALLEQYRGAVVVGLTATPALGNGKGLGHIYNGLEMAVSTARLVEEGWLLPCKVFAPDKPDLRGVRLDKNGDYNKAQLAQRMDRPKITGNVLENWKRHAVGRRTVVFCCTIQHAKHVCEEFRAAGFPFRHIDQTTPDDEREEIFRLIKEGKVRGFTNVSVARRGLDVPSLECACVVRPTRSLVLWLQMIGRIRRPSPDTGKADCVVIDHAGACDNHCMPDDEIAWGLDGTRKIGDWLQQQKDDGKLPRSSVCPECDCMFTGKRCPNCGFTFKEKVTATREIEHADGILVERTASDGQHPVEHLQRRWNRAIAIAINRGQKLGMAVHIFHDEFNKAPWEFAGLDNVPPPGETWRRPAAEVFPNFTRVKVRG